MEIIEKKTTEAQKRAKAKYMENYVEIKVRVTRERRNIIKMHAEKFDKQSVTAFINRAIDETMENDLQKQEEKREIVKSTPTRETMHRAIDLVDENMIHFMSYSMFRFIKEDSMSQDYLDILIDEMAKTVNEYKKKHKRNNPTRTLDTEGNKEL